MEDQKHLPIELVTEILPVKSLLRFLCFCKSWHSLISSPYFVYLHLARFHEDDDDNSTLLTYDDDNTLILTFIRHQATNHTPISTSIGHGHTADDGWMLRSTRTFRKCPDNYFIHGDSVNGSLLLASLFLSCKLGFTEMMLWNPIIGKAHKLPNLEICDPVYLGLGVNLSSNDYKVVVIAKKPYTSVHLYTHSIRTWRTIVDHEESMISILPSRGVLIQDTILWIILESEEESGHMVSFDVKDEVFDYTALPSADSTSSRSPIAYREWVELFDICDNDKYSGTLWVMEKDCVPGSWRKLYTINFRERYFPLIICFKKNGQFVFSTHRGIIKLSNMETQHVKFVKNHSFRSLSFLDIALFLRRAWYYYKLERAQRSLVLL